MTTMKSWAETRSLVFYRFTYGLLRPRRNSCGPHMLRDMFSEPGRSGSQRPRIPRESQSVHSRPVLKGNLPSWQAPTTGSCARATTDRAERRLRRYVRSRWSRRQQRSHCCVRSTPKRSSHKTRGRSMVVMMFSLKSRHKLLRPSRDNIYFEKRIALFFCGISA